jgi:two-component system sensor histidine kinase/response regulator
MLKLFKKFSQKRILLVDDEEFCIATLTTLLQCQNIDTVNLVDICINGIEALNHLVSAYSSGITYSVIFMDFSMPIMDGIEATKAIR